MRPIFSLLWLLHVTLACGQSNQTACLPSAASYHGVNQHLLLAVLTVESGLNPQAIGKNNNGTFDLGMGQINSIHLPDLQRYGLTAQHLFDPCKSIYVSAWFLRRGLDRYGYTWFGAATYHSTKPEHNLRYQNLLQGALIRKGIDPASVLIAAGTNRSNSE